MSGKLIVIEGGDGAGKGTQAKLLEQALASQTKITYLDFPRYQDSVFGELLGHSLAGDYGNFLELSPYLSSLPYMLDRASALDVLTKALKKGHVLCNRYTTSSMAYQSAKLAFKEQENFITFLERAEYDELKLPKPDIVVYLSVSVEKSNELIAKKEQRSHLNSANKDQHESDLDYLAKVRQVYLMLAKKRPEWHVLNCMHKTAILPPEVIHERILEIVAPLLL